MTVDVELFGQLLPEAPRRRALNLEGEITVRELAITLGLDPDTVGLVVVDGVQRDMDDLVPPNCRLCFFPPVSGG